MGADARFKNLLLYQGEKDRTCRFPACGSSDHSLVFFYPKANAPGCTKQASSTRNSRADLAKAGIAYVGVSSYAPKPMGALQR
jgi:peroxiredoxin